MYNVHLTHSLLCFEFVELTLFYLKRSELFAGKEIIITFALANAARAG